MATNSNPPSVRASAPLDATMAPGGVNFSVFSRNATAVDLLFFDGADDRRPSRVIPIDPAANRSYHYGTSSFLAPHGFTRHPSSGVAEGKRGTYAGLVEKIPYLGQLGITAVELLPVFQFGPGDAPPVLTNYWGYSPVSFFAPHSGYSSVRSPLGPVNEFRDMVKALHRAGIEVILDAVLCTT